MYSQKMSEIDRIAVSQLEADGHRYTRGRRLILATLAKLSRPATIPTILDAERGLTLSSLYRNMSILEGSGLVARLTVGSDHALYELSEALTEHHHHHLICRQCNNVTDVDLSARTERLLDRTLSEASEANGFTLEHHRLDLIGVCEACRV